MRTVLAILASLVTLGGCQRNVSPDTYSVGSVGQVNRVAKGIIISTRAVNIGGSQSGLGSMTGAAGGGIVGSQIGRGSGNAAAILAGVVIGGIAGAVAEDAATRQTGIEYVIETENGLLMTLVQGPNPSFSQGQKVLVIYGSPSRLVAALSENRLGPNANARDSLSEVPGKFFDPPDMGLGQQETTQYRSIDVKGEARNYDEDRYNDMRGGDPGGQSGRQSHQGQV